MTEYPSVYGDCCNQSRYVADDLLEYPCLHGDNFAQYPLASTYDGIPPLTRGQRTVWRQGATKAGNTPTHTGTTELVRVGRRCGMEYSRAHGDNNHPEAGQL